MGFFDEKNRRILYMNKIAFIGAGSMAEAIIAGIIHTKTLTADQIYVTNKSDDERLEALKQTYQINCDKNKETVIKDADVIILSMKPQDIEEAVKAIQPFIKRSQLIISVVAGVLTSRIKQLTNSEAPIIRAMPNTSASIGLSGTALSLGPQATEKHLEVAQKLFQTIGMTVTVAEMDMHIVTAISGSGPAYIYYFVEMMEQAAIEFGCDQKIAQDLIVQMVKGASEMLKTSNKSAQKLRQEITSPQGTTEAGIKALKKHNFPKAIKSCIESSKNRSIELSKKF